MKKRTIQEKSQLLLSSLAFGFALCLACCKTSTQSAFTCATWNELLDSAFQTINLNEPRLIVLKDELQYQHNVMSSDYARTIRGSSYMIDKNSGGSNGFREVNNVECTVNSLMLFSSWTILPDSILKSDFKNYSLGYYEISKPQASSQMDTVYFEINYKSFDGFCKGFIFIRKDGVYCLNDAVLISSV